MRLQDKVILITGSYTGIGKAIARRSVAEGASVVLNGLEEEPGKSLAAELGEKSIAVTGDITASGVIEKLIGSALQTFGKLDAVVNNAAMIVGSNIENTDLDFFRRILEVNTLAPFNLIKQALPHLSAQRGCVLNIGSVNAWCGEPNLLAYSVSKGALQTLTRNLGDTLHRENSVRVNQINPGWVLTENEAALKRKEGFDDNWDALLPEVYAPAGRILRPEEIAAAAIYWLSDEAGPISGQVVELEQHPLIGRNPPKDIAIFKK